MESNKDSDWTGDQVPLGSCSYCGGEDGGCYYCDNASTLESKQTTCDDKVPSKSKLILEINEDDEEYLFACCPHCKSNSIYPIDNGLCCKKCEVSWSPFSMPYENESSEERYQVQCVWCQQKRGIIQYPNGTNECFTCKCLWHSNIKDAKGKYKILRNGSTERTTPVDENNKSLILNAEFSVHSTKQTNNLPKNSICPHCKEGFMQNGQCTCCLRRNKSKQKLLTTCNCCGTKFPPRQSKYCDDCQDQVEECIESMSSIDFISQCVSCNHPFDLNEQFLYAYCPTCKHLESVSSGMSDWQLNLLRNIISNEPYLYKKFIENRHDLGAITSSIMNLFESLREEWNNPSYGETEEIFNDLENSISQLVELIDELSDYNGDAYEYRYEDDSTKFDSNEDDLYWHQRRMEMFPHNTYNEVTITEVDDETFFLLAEVDNALPDSSQRPIIIS